MRDDDAVKLLFRRVVAGLTYIFLGLLIEVWLLGPALLGYRGGLEADMAAAAGLWLTLIWLACFPLFLLVGLAIDGVLRFLGFNGESRNLR